MIDSEKAKRALQVFFDSLSAEQERLLRRWLRATEEKPTQRGHRKQAKGQSGK